MLIKKLGYTLKDSYLKADNLMLDRGKIYVVTGINGCGKTTFLRILSRLIKADELDIVHDVDMSSLAAFPMYFESSKWFHQNLKGRDYLTFYKKMWESNKDKEEVIKRWNLDSFISHKIKTYSLGMNQRLLLALYDMADADILLLDEPSIGLDRKSLTILYDFLLRQKKQNKLILLSSHIGEEIREISDVTLLIEDGQIKGVDES